jgi:hypothetical protein
VSTLFLFFLKKNHTSYNNQENLCSFKRSSRSLMIVKQGVCHTLHMALPFNLLKSILRRQFKYFTMQKFKNLKNPLKETKVL